MSPESDQLVTPLPRGRATPIVGDLRCPSDKSITHRALIFAAMAKGTSRIERPLTGADCLSTMAALSALGVRLTLNSHVKAEPTIHVESPGMEGWRSPLIPLDFGNSGTTARLLTGLFAARPGLFVMIFGDQSLSQRPMGRVVGPLRQIGASILGRHEGQHLPLAILGQKLKAGTHLVDKASAQVKSALLLAGLSIDGETVITLPSGSRDHTEALLQAFGAPLTIERTSQTETLRLRGPFTPPSGTYHVPGDPSSAAFLCAMAAIGSEARITVREVLNNPTRSGFLTVLERMAVPLQSEARLRSTGYGEAAMDLHVSSPRVLNAVEVEAELAPTLIDEVPILAAVALFAKGRSRFRGLGELRVKESDRLSKTLELLQAAGGQGHIEEDDLIVKGGLDAPEAFDFDPVGDHRLAMAATVLAQFAKGTCRVRDPECVAVSFPGFHAMLASLSRRGAS